MLHHHTWHESHGFHSQVAKSFICTDHSFLRWISLTDPLTCSFLFSEFFLLVLSSKNPPWMSKRCFESFWFCYPDLSPIVVDVRHDEAIDSAWPAHSCHRDGSCLHVSVTLLWYRLTLWWINACDDYRVVPSTRLEPRGHLQSARCWMMTTDMNLWVSLNMN